MTQLLGGDLLFRYLPPSQQQSPARSPHLGVKGVTETQIANKQRKQIQGLLQRKPKLGPKETAEDFLDNLAKKDPSKALENFDKYWQWRLMTLEATNVTLRMASVGHVGIADPAWGFAWEVANGGFQSTHITKRTKHYDIIVRFNDGGEEILAVARRVRWEKYDFHGRGWARYPVEHLDKIAKNPPDPDLFWTSKKRLEEADRKHEQNMYKFSQDVVCSHAVHAILYAAFYPGATVATATEEDFKDIFMISPAGLMRFIRYQLGLLRRQEKAVIVGIHHQGKVCTTYDKLEDIFDLKDQVKRLQFA